MSGEKARKRRIKDSEEETGKIFLTIKRIRPADGDPDDVSMFECQRTVRFMCDTCPKWFNNKRGLLIHQQQPNDGWAAIEQQQPACPAPRPEGRRRRRPTDGDPSNDDMAVDGRAAFVCDRCPEVFACAPKLSAHRRTHVGKPRLKCTKCEMMFENRVHLVKHARTRHSDSTVRGRSTAATPTAAAAAASSIAAPTGASSSNAETTTVGPSAPQMY